MKAFDLEKEFNEDKARAKEAGVCVCCGISREELAKHNKLTEDERSVLKPNQFCGYCDEEGTELLNQYREEQAERHSEEVFEQD